jgi:hypothetical protein
MKSLYVLLNKQIKSRTTMMKRIWRLIGRPKTGQKYYSTTLSLTLAQKDFLSKQANASELIRRLIDDLIIAKAKFNSDMAEELRVIAIKHQIEQLNKDAEVAYEEWHNFWRFSRPKGLQSESCRRDGTSDGVKLVVGKTAEEKYYLKTLRALMARAEKIDAKIEQLKQEVGNE